MGLGSTFLAPDETAVLDVSRPVNHDCALTQGLRGWWHAGLREISGGSTTWWRDLTRQYRASIDFSNSGQTGSAQKPAPGVTGVWRTTADSQSVAGAAAFMDQVFPNSTRATVLLVHRKTDTTLRTGTAFGTNPGGGSNEYLARVLLPFTDNKVYWDYGGQSEGSTRLSVSITADTDWHWWGFTVGDGLGMRIYKDGALLASNGGTPSRSLGGGGNFLVNASVLLTGDLAEWSELLVFDRGLRLDEYQEWVRQMKAGHPDTLRRWSPKDYLFFSGAEGTVDQVNYSNDTTADFYMVLNNPWEFETDTQTDNTEFVDEDAEYETVTELLAYAGGSLTAEPAASFPLEFETVTLAGNQALFSGPTLVSYKNVTAVATTAAVADVAEFETVTGARVRVGLFPDGRRDLLDDRRYRR